MRPSITKIAVIGAGITGLTAAYKLIQQGYDVTLFESASVIGGLARTVRVADSLVEAYYHHYFTSDDTFFELCKELGIGDRIIRLPAKMGYLSSGKAYNFGTPWSLLTFSPFSFSDKIRCALSALAIKKEHSLEKMDNCTVEDWFIKHAGIRVYEVIWKPLLIQKFGSLYKKIPMAWIWRKVHVRALSKKNIFPGEKLVYLKGSIAVYINALKEKIESQKGRIFCGEKVREIKRDNNGRFIVKTPNQSLVADAVLSTIPAPILKDIVEFDNPFKDALFRFRFLAVVCVLLVLKRPLTDYYWLNVGDESFPFGLAVEHTNFCSSSDYNNRHLIYLSKYCEQESNIFSKFTELEVVDNFVGHLERINANFKKDDIEYSYVFRDHCAQPIIEMPFLPYKPAISTPLPNFYWVSTHHIYPDDRGVNYAVELAYEAARQVNSGMQQKS